MTMKAHLLLSDGTIFSGESFGYEAGTDGEVVFTTGMVGYTETLTDPSFVGQILCLTYPMQGNYGVPDIEERDERGLKKYLESDTIHIQALIVNNYSDMYNHREATMSLGDFLKRHKKPGISGIDTRALTKKLREEGSMLGKIIIGEIDVGSGFIKTAKQTGGIKTEQQVGGIKTKQQTGFIKTKQQTGGITPIQDPNERNLVGEVSCREVITYGTGKKRICVVDLGIKNNIIRSLLDCDTTVIRVPHDYPFMDGSIEFDGLFLSNGPGDPTQNTIAIQNIKKAFDRRIPIFGICLGNQLLALAAGAQTFKLKYGHRGQNQPCKDLTTGACVITSQNHGFAVDNDTLPDGISPWFINSNDQTNEGMIFSDIPVKSVQFHPESAPGPNDTVYLFQEFVESL